MRIFLTTLIFGIASIAFAQSSLWRSTDEGKLNRRSAIQIEKTPISYSLWQLDESKLDKIAGFGTSGVRNFNQDASFDMDIPGLDKELYKVTFTEYALVAPGLLQKYPELKAFRGKTESGAAVYLNKTKKGYHFTVLDKGKTFYIEPNSEGDNFYFLYDINDYPISETGQNFVCEVDSKSTDDLVTDPSLNGQDLTRSRRGNPIQLRTYRIAMATTGAYTNAVGGSISDALAAITTVVNRLNSIYETEGSITFQVVEDNDRIVYTDAASDPYTDGNAGQMIEANQETCDLRIGGANYDFGHVMGFTGTSANGLAQVGTICRGGKARAASIAENVTTADPFIVNIISHEMGHQFSAFHTMYHCHNVNPSTAVEPGSGSTIMSYAGICNPASNNVQNDADPYFHGVSLQSVISFSRFNVGNTCAVKEDIGNTEPDIEILSPLGVTIPANTPFRLMGRATDLEDNNLTYVWDQMDVGPSNPEPILGSPSGNAAIFRSYSPTGNSTRYFPSLNYLTSNTYYIFELLPTYTRDMSFRFIVRDNYPGGGAAVWQNYTTSVDQNSGPFEVLVPNDAGLEYNAGDMISVSWDLARTNLDPVNCAVVEIKLSVDGGSTYPYTLNYGTDNDGNEMVLLPDVQTDQARIMVAAVDNIFFDISDNDFKIGEATAPGYYVNFENQEGEVCIPEFVEISIPTSQFVDYSDPIQFSIKANDFPDGIVSFGEDEILPGETNTIEFDLSQNLAEGEYTVVFETNSSNGVTFERSVTLNLIPNNIDDLMLLLPADGSKNVTPEPIFSWSTAANAETYTFQLASSPDFDTDLIYEQFGITSGGAVYPDELETNHVYYWRIFSTNRCGTQLHPEIFTFQTVNIDCRSWPYEGDPIIILPPGTPTIEPEVNISDDLQIDALNIADINGSHTSFKDLTWTLVTPENEEIVLMDTICDGAFTFDFTLDENALTDVSSCELENGKNLKPAGSLNGLVGKSTMGKWVLRIKDNVPGSGGILTGFAIEACANLNPKDPVLVRNDTLKVKPGFGRFIDLLFLEATDEDNSNDEIIFTLVTQVTKGEILLDGVPLALGETFTQADVNNESVVYKHSGNEEEEDFFLFTITDPGGGFFGTPRFEIRMDDDETIVPVTDVENTREVSVYPNPANQSVKIEFDNPVETKYDLLVFDITGKVVLNRKNIFDRNIQIETGDFAQGLYWIHLKSKDFDIKHKLSIQHD